MGWILPFQLASKINEGAGVLMILLDYRLLVSIPKIRRKRKKYLFVGINIVLWFLSEQQSTQWSQKTSSFVQKWSLWTNLSHNFLRFHGSFKHLHIGANAVALVLQPISEGSTLLYWVYFLLLMAKIREWRRKIFTFLLIIMSFRSVSFYNVEFE